MCHVTGTIFVFIMFIKNKIYLKELSRYVKHDIWEYIKTVFSQ